MLIQMVSHYLFKKTFETIFTSHDVMNIQDEIGKGIRYREMHRL